MIKLDIIFEMLAMLEIFFSRFYRQFIGNMNIYHAAYNWRKSSGITLPPWLDITEYYGSVYYCI